VVVVAGHVERGDPVLALCVDGRLPRQQQPRNLVVAVLGRQVERREALLRGRADGRALVEQNGCDLLTRTHTHTQTQKTKQMVRKKIFEGGRNLSR
jgi:hypothetical protein